MTELIGIIGICLAVMTAVISLTVWITRFKTKNDTDHKIYEKNFDKLFSVLDAIKDNVFKLSVEKDLRTSIKTEDTGFVQSNSPLSVAPRGQEISDELNFTQMIANNWQSIHSRIKENVKSRNAYDIQEYCVDLASIHIDKVLTGRDLERVKLKAYNKGDNVYFYGKVLGVMIRDKYFEVENIKTQEEDIEAT